MTELRFSIYSKKQNTTIFFADREITDGGILAALLLGIIGAILWIVVDMSRTKERVQKVQGGIMAIEKVMKEAKLAQKTTSVGAAFGLANPDVKYKKNY
jgi:hypothetical protein